MAKLPKAEHDKLAALPHDEKMAAIDEQVTRIHLAVFSGTYDTPTIEDALARLKALTSKPSDEHKPHPLIPELVTTPAPG